eukprot:4713879-Amphidinium_carterae.1
MTNGTPNTIRPKVTGKPPNRTGEPPKTEQKSMEVFTKNEKMRNAPYLNREPHPHFSCRTELVSGMT